MNNEFKKIKSKTETRYVLETMTSGGTGADSIATSPQSVGKTQQRLLTPAEGKEKKVPVNKPRNFVAKNAKMGGAGTHKDKKKAAKQGDVKHKAKELEVAEAYGRRSSYGYNPERDAQDQWDAARRADQDFRNRERNAGDDGEEYYRQQVDKDRGPWYLKIDGKIYKQKGIPKSFDWKSGASKYGMAILKNNPNLQGKIYITKKAEDDTAESAPPGWEKTVKAMKKHDEIDNPFALAWSMKNKGYKSHKKESTVGEATPTGNEIDVRRKLIKYIAREKGWGISDLELASTEELVDMYKQCQKDRKAWRNRRSDWMSNADDQARKTGGDKWEIMRKTSKDYDLDGPEQGELNFKEDAYIESLFKKLEEKAKK
jgi:hypothetical protein